RRRATSYGANSLARTIPERAAVLGQPTQLISELGQSVLDLGVGAPRPRKRGFSSRDQGHMGFGRGGAADAGQLRSNDLAEDQLRKRSGQPNIALLVRHLCPPGNRYRAATPQFLGH